VSILVPILLFVTVYKVAFIYGESKNETTCSVMEYSVMLLSRHICVKYT